MSSPEPRAVAASQDASALLTAQHPYTGPSHDRQKLIRASLASSCLRGEMRAWQFQGAGDDQAANTVVQGRVLRRQPHKWRDRLLRGGVFHRVCRERALRGEEHLRPFTQDEYRCVADALSRGHTEQAEWLMSGRVRAFEDGLFYTVLPQDLFTASPLPALLRSACQIDWDWGRRRVVQMVAESDDQDTVRLRESGASACVCALACASAGSSNSLQWAEAFAADTTTEAMTLLLLSSSVLTEVAGTCTLSVAEWLWAAVSSFSSASVRQAAAKGNWPVMEWLVRRCGPIEPTLFYLDAAAKGNSVAAMRFLCEHGLQRASSLAGYNAASYGSLSVLEWLLANKPNCVTEGAVARAARTGNVDKVRCLVVHRGMRWTDEAADEAVASGCVGLLEWALGHRLDMPRTLFDMLGPEVPLPMVHFLLANAPNMACDHQTMLMACSHSLSVVEAIHARFPRLLSFGRGYLNLRDAVHAGRLDVVEFILDTVQECVCIEQILEEACMHNNLQLVELLHARYPDVPFTDLAMRRATSCGALSVVEWLHQLHGLPPDPTTAIASGRYQVLEFFIGQCGVTGPLDPIALRSSVERNHVHVVEYVARHGLVASFPMAVHALLSTVRTWTLKRFLHQQVNGIGDFH